MLRHHMAVFTRDTRLKREVQRVTAATGSTADFAADESGLSADKQANLAIFDARTSDPPAALRDKLPKDASFIWILDEQKLLEKVDTLADDRVVSLMCHDARFDDDEFIASATKALRGTVFGLPKYFPWGVTTYTMVVKNYEEKSKAIDIIMRYAQLAGIRGPVRDRIQVVADELMMNALYHAPTDAEGKERFRDKTLKELAQLPEVPAIEVQYGSSGRYFGMSVRDGGGSLSRQRVVQYLRRAASGTATIENKTSGAGLGLVTVLKSVSKLVFNLDPGRSTEVIGLFDLELFAKGKVGARSVHVFTSREEAPAEEPAEEEEAVAPPPLAPSRRGVWALAAILLAAVAAMGGALVSQRLGVGVGREAAAGDAAAMPAPPPAPSVMLSPEPRDAVITVENQVVNAGDRVPVDRPVTVKLEKAGYQSFEARVEADAPTGAVKLHLPLLPVPQARRERPNPNR